MRPLRKLAAFALLTALPISGMAVDARAQTPDADRPDPKKKAAAADAPELPVSLERIRRELAQQPRTSESRDGLRLSYYVEVYGKAPRLELLTPGENIAAAPVMYGGMTHQEFLQVVTPQEFKSPAADIPAAIAALVKWAVAKKKNESR